MAAIKTIFSNTRYRIIALLIVMASFVYALIANAELEDCGQVLCLPGITEGNVFNDQFYNGEISIGARYTDADVFLFNESVAYTLNANSASPAWQTVPFPFTSEIETEAGGTTGDLIRHVVHLSDGNYAVLSVRFRQFSEVEVYRSDGSVVGTGSIDMNMPILVNSYGIARLSNGGFVVGWVEGSSPHFNYIQFFDANATATSGKILVSNEPGFDLEIKEGTGGSGFFIETDVGFHIFNEQNQNTGTVSGLDVQRGRGGVEVTRLKGVNAQAVIAAWPTRTGISMRMYGLGGQALSSTMNVITYGTLAFEGPQVAALDDGGFVVTWGRLDGLGGSTPKHLYMEGQRYNASLQPLGPRLQITDTPDEPLMLTRLKSLVPLPDGGILYFWTFDYDDTAGSWTTFYRRYNSQFQAGPAATPPGLDFVPHGGSGVGAGWVFKINDAGDVFAYIERIGSPQSPVEENIVVYPKKKIFSVENLAPEQDIDLQFRVGFSGVSTIFSPIRTYLYGDPNVGQGGSISYPHGYTNQTQVNVSLDLPDRNSGLYQSVQLYQRTAALSNDSCGAFGGWGVVGTQSTLTEVEPVTVNDALCYQFKWMVTNTFNNSFDYTNTNIVKVDRTPPVINIASQQVVLDELQLTLAIDEPVSAIATQSYRLNSQAPVTFTGSTLDLQALNGGNRVELAATDLAGNTANRIFNIVADLTPPDILIHGLVDGGVYGGNAPLEFTLTQPLTNLEILVNGQPRSDLVGLPNGQHTVTIRGLDAQGNLISKTITITIDNSILSLTLLSPQARTYQKNTVTIAYQSSQPLDSVSYRLNGGPVQQGTVLADLADGTYNLTVTGVAGGNSVSASVQFTVQEGIPTLSVEAPQPGVVLPSNTVAVVFGSNSPVTYEVAGMSGNLASGQTLILPEAGEHILTLTATHPVSGNIVRQQVAFTTDPVIPSIDLQSPRAQLYSFSEIPIQYTPNKLMKNVVTTLDGVPVSSLKNLASGNHQFVLTAEDSAGRTVQKTVNFTVSYLDIVAPTQGEKVVSNTFPSRFAMDYAADGVFSTITARIDNGSQQLIVNPPGVPTTLQTTLGEHELTVIGNLNEFSTAKRVAFELGAKNVSAGADSIDYTTSNCDAAFNCDVNVILKVRNTGTFDIDEPFDLRLDHVGIGGGSQTLVQQAGPLVVGATAEIVLPVLQASLGDTFSLTIDPQAALSDEYVADNNHQASFLPGRITQVGSSLHRDNVYFEGVSVINVLSVTTVGAIESVQFSGPGVDFVDDDPSDGFALIADMGLLTRENPCGQLMAFNSEGLLMDSRSLCYQITKTEVNGLVQQIFPWSQFATVVNNKNRVVMADVNMADLLLAITESSLATLNQPVSLHSSVRKNGKVVYRMLTDASLANNGPATQRVNLDGFPFLGNELELPAGRSVFVSSINAADGVCTADGAIPLFKKSIRQNIEELYADELAEIREGALTREELISSLIFGDAGDHVIPPDMLDPVKLFLAEYANFITEYGLPGIPVNQDIPEASNVLSRWDGIFTGVARLKLPDKIYQVDVSGSRTTGFDSNGCLLVDKDGVTDIVFDGNYEDRIRLDVNPRTGKIEFDLLGVASLGFANMGSFDVLDIPLIPLALVTVDVDVHPINIHIPINLGYKVGLSVVGEDVFLGPLHIAFNTRINHYQKLAEIDGTAYLLGILGSGIEYKAHLTVDAVAKLDLIAGIPGGTPTIDQLSSIVDAFAYKHSDVYLEVKKRKKACLGPFCKKRDWRIDSQTTRRETETEGVSYTSQQVADSLAAHEPVDLGSIEDLVGLVAYYDLIGRDDLGADLVKCSVLQAFAKDMPNTPIYTNHAGMCRLVTDPDQGETGQQYFADPSCQTPLPFKPTTFLNYCTSALTPDRTYVGNAAAWTSDGDARYNSLGRNTRWSLAHGPTLDFWALPPGNNRRPFIKKAEYKSVNGCQLEMRIYKQDILAENLKPLMFIHGGSFKYRGFGTLGMESAISHFTERGYIVFAPYYRLMDDRDGPAACQNAHGTEIVADIEDALQWVRLHGPTVGSNSSGVTLVGQSAGSHLAGWLATHPTLSADVRNMLLFYPPTDLRFIAEQSQPGGLYESTFDVAKGLVAEFFDVADISTVNLADPFVISNSFPGRIAGGMAAAPAFMIHGNNDTLVPIEMSTRMCDAKAGSALGTTPVDSGVYNCGPDNSRLHIIEGAEHILDLRCFAEDIYSDVFSLLEGDAAELPVPCPSGILGAPQVRTAIETGLNWLN